MEFQLEDAYELTGTIGVNLNLVGEADRRLRLREEEVGSLVDTEQVDQPTAPATAGSSEIRACPFPEPLPTQTETVRHVRDGGLRASWNPRGFG